MYRTSINPRNHYLSSQSLTTPSSYLITLQEQDKNSDEITNSIGSKISILGILNMCWAFTMKFSSDSKQVEIGTKLFEDFSTTCQNESDKETIFQMKAAIGKTLRNIGYIRNGYVEYKKILDEASEKNIAVIDGLGSITSKDSLGAKIIVFLTTALVGGVEKIREPITNMLKVASNSTDSLNNTLTAPSPATTKTATEAFQIDIAIFIIIGLISVALFTVGFSIYKPRYERKKKAETMYMKEDFYQHKFKKDMTKCLYQLYIDLKNSKNNRFKDDLPADAENFIEESIIPTLVIDKNAIKELFKVDSKIK